MRALRPHAEPQATVVCCPELVRPACFVLTGCVLRFRERGEWGRRRGLAGSSRAQRLLPELSPGRFVMFSEHIVHLTRIGAAIIP